MVTQFEYGGIESDLGSRETAAERQARYLQRQLDQLEAEKLGLTLGQLEEQRWEELAKRTARPHFSPIVQALEQARAMDAAWLARVGVPEDADEHLKVTILALRDEQSQVLFARLVTAIVGKSLEAVQGQREIVSNWTLLTTDVRMTIAAAALRHNALIQEARSQASVA